jgi:hypothetical protein
MGSYLVGARYSLSHCSVGAGDSLSCYLVGARVSYSDIQLELDVLGHVVHLELDIRLVNRSIKV